MPPEHFGPPMCHEGSEESPAPGGLNSAIFVKRPAVSSIPLPTAAFSSLLCTIASANRPTIKYRKLRARSRLKLLVLVVPLPTSVYIIEAQGEGR